MKLLMRVIVLFVVVFIFGCSQNIPMKSSINEFVLMNIKTSSHRGINYTYQSKLIGTKLPIYGKDKKPLGGMYTYNADETTTLKVMLSEYVQNKFLEISAVSPISFDVTLDDFYVEYYSTDNFGTQLLQGLADVESNYMSSAKLVLLVRLDMDGKEVTKRLSTSSDVTTVGSQSSKGIGDSINQVNNKMLMLINAFLSESGL
jgi:hypothetical protein